MTIAREALPFALPLAGLAVLLAATRHPLGAVLAALAGAAVTLFFRVPRRLPPADAAAVLAPANGRVLAVDEIEDAAVGPGRWRRIVIFLSVFDVHVQRAPVGGAVERTGYRPGRKLAAFLPAAGEENESRLVVLRTAAGERVAVRQVAGLLARRTVGYLSAGEAVERGALIGLIKFGSRVDLLLPLAFAVTAEVGQRLVDGETVVARRAAP